MRCDFSPDRCPPSTHQLPSNLEAVPADLGLAKGLTLLLVLFISLWDVKLVIFTVEFTRVFLVQRPLNLQLYKRLLPDNLAVQSIHCGDKKVSEDGLPQSANLALEGVRARVLWDQGTQWMKSVKIKEINFNLCKTWAVYLNKIIGHCFIYTFMSRDLIYKIWINDLKQKQDEVFDFSPLF